MKKELLEIEVLRKRAGIDDKQINVLSRILNFLPDAVVDAGEKLEKELRKSGVKLESNAKLINAIEDLVLAAKHSK
jgi:hypothetical protein